MVGQGGKVEVAGGGLAGGFLTYSWLPAVRTSPNCRELVCCRFSKGSVASCVRITPAVIELYN